MGKLFWLFGGLRTFLIGGYMDKSKWIDRYQGAWSEKGNFSELLGLLAISDTDTNLLAQSVKLDIPVSTALDALKLQGQEDLMMRVLDSCAHTWREMDNASFEARRQLFRESLRGQLSSIRLRTRKIGNRCQINKSMSR